MNVFSLYEYIVERCRQPFGLSLSNSTNVTCVICHVIRAETGSLLDALILKWTRRFLIIGLKLDYWTENAVDDFGRNWNFWDKGAEVGR